MDSTLQVNINYSSDVPPQEWRFNLEDNVLILKNYLTKTTTIKFSEINCNQLPDKANYSPVEEIAEEEEAEYNENYPDTVKD